MNLQNFWKNSTINKNQVADLIGNYTMRNLLEEEKRCIDEVLSKIKEYNLADEIDDNAIHMTVFLLNEKSNNGNPLLMLVKPWVSHDYSGNIFYVDNGGDRREVFFQSFFDDDKACEFASQFLGLNSCDEVCKKEEELREEKAKTNLEEYDL